MSAGCTILFYARVLRTLEVAQVRLLVELGFIQSERVDNIDLGLLLVVGILAGLLGRCVGTSVEALTTDSDLGAVGLVNDAVDLLEVVGVGDQLIAGDDVLRNLWSINKSVCPSFAIAGAFEHSLLPCR